MAPEWKNIRSWRRGKSSGTELCFSNPLASFFYISTKKKKKNLAIGFESFMWLLNVHLLHDHRFGFSLVKWNMCFPKSALAISSLCCFLMAAINLRTGSEQSCIHPAPCSSSHWYLLPHLQATAKLWSGGAEGFECYNTHIYVWKTDKYAQILLPCWIVSALQSQISHRDALFFE